VKPIAYRRLRTHLVAALSCLLFVFASIGAATAAVTLTPDPPSGALVGTQIIWTASDSVSGLRQYRFSVEYPNGASLIVRDFDLYNSFPWTPLEEGLYKVSVTVRDPATQSFQDVAQSFQVTSRITDSKAVVTPTLHPLVALYSIPPCPKGKEVRVQFREKGDKTWQCTPYKPFQGRKSVNFLVAGMKADQKYEIRHETVCGKSREVSKPLCFTTGSSELPPWEFKVTCGPFPKTSTSDGVLLHAILFGGEGANIGLGCPVATDLGGSVLWYFKEPLDLLNYAGSFLMSFPPSVSGTLLVPMASPPIPNVLPGPYRGRLLREIDLAGNFIRETNVDRINEQLAVLGFDPIYYFHHDARRLPNGHTLVLAGVEKIFTGGEQGAGPIDVVGDAVIDLDENFQVVWAWNTFGHDELPVTRRALRDELCTGVPMNVCGPLRLSGPYPGQVSEAHDWTHCNTVTYTPADGNILLSFRHQDWLVKIDYANGKGSGKVLWRLGKDGDFDIQQKFSAPDPHPWFSAQHQAMIYAQNELVVYDNSNARNEPTDQGFNSRGQVYLLNEKTQKATLITSADLGVYASFLGSAQKLSNGNYHFLSGGIAGDQPSPVPGFPAGLSESTEVGAGGNLVYTLQAPFHTTYRSFRMKSMYRPAGIPGDIDGDSDVDGMDLAQLGSRLFQRAASGFDPCDVDGDRWITAKDLQKATTQCTLPYCKVLNWVSPVLGY
jgi:arylsulfate sulfotransferase